MAEQVSSKEGEAEEILVDIEEDRLVEKAARESDLDEDVEMIELEEVIEKKASSPTIRSVRKASPPKHSPQKSIATP